MKHLMSVARAAGCLLIVAAAASSASGQPPTEVVADVPRWRPDSLPMQVLSTVLFAGLGIVLAIVGFKLFDLATPFSLESEICERQNIAVAIISGSMIIGISIIIAVAVI